MLSQFIIITSIHGVTEAVKAFAGVDGWHVVVVGDKKTPPLDTHPFPNVTFLSIADQATLPFSFHDHCPFNHYVRKNLGYLYAIQQGATQIADSDDDNFPYPDWPGTVAGTATIATLADAKIVNIYRYFTDQFIWPRGFPLDAILTATTATTQPPTSQSIGVWQGLADKDPDVDAIYRLTINQPVIFDKKPSLALAAGMYCPFNSQNTIWTTPACFPYLYLPISVSFRFCDILRSYVAQRGLWAMNARLAFTTATAYQERNVHDFMVDFKDEIPCYQHVRSVITTLDDLELTGVPTKDIVTMYEALQKINVVDQRDVAGVRAFVGDLAGTP